MGNPKEEVSNPIDRMPMLPNYGFFVLAALLVIFSLKLWTWPPSIQWWKPLACLLGAWFLAWLNWKIVKEDERIMDAAIKDYLEKKQSQLD